MACHLIRKLRYVISDGISCLERTDDDHMLNASGVMGRFLEFTEIWDICT